jgi:hypothetical protein
VSRVRIPSSPPEFVILLVQINPMPIFKTAILAYHHLFKDLKNNLSIKIFIWGLLYSLLLLYIMGVVDRIVGSGNTNTLTLLKSIIYIQQLPIIFFVVFSLKQIYLLTISSQPFISQITADFKSIQSDNRVFRSFTIYAFIAYVPLYLLSALIGYNFSWSLLVLILFPGYFFVFPAFVLIERPQTTYLQSVLLVSKAIHKKSKLILITFITAAVFMLVHEIVRSILVGFIAYKVVVSNGQNATTGLMLALAGLWDFITIYLGMIIYIKLSLILYLRFRDPVKHNALS